MQALSVEQAQQSSTAVAKYDGCYSIECGTEKISVLYKEKFIRRLSLPFPPAIQAIHLTQVPEGKEIKRVCVLCLF